MAFLLVHGGQHDARCWTPTVDALHRQAPGTAVVAVDLPGRGALGDPAELMEYDVDRCVARIHTQVPEELDDLVVVGHSAAGLVLPSLVRQLGDRVRHVVFAACAVPAENDNLLGTLRGPLRHVAALAARRRSPMPPLPRALAAWAFCNGMSRAQRELTLSLLVAEAPHLARVRARPSDLPVSTPRTWVLTTRDRALRPRVQRAAIDRLGGVDRLIPIDAPHDVMISHPDELARILLTISADGRNSG